MDLLNRAAIFQIDLFDGSAGTKYVNLLHRCPVGARCSPGLESRLSETRFQPDWPRLGSRKVCRLNDMVRHQELSDILPLLHRSRVWKIAVEYRQGIRVDCAPEAVIVL